MNEERNSWKQNISGLDSELDLLFQRWSEGEEFIPVQKLLNILRENGIGKEDLRIRKCMGAYLQEEKSAEERIDRGDFIALLKKPESEIIRKVLTKQLVIPHFTEFSKDIEAIFQKTKSNTEGEMDETLPHPQPERQPAYAVSICTVDGQLLQLGDHDLAFLIQSICKPVNYAIAIEEAGKDKVHEHVGVEPGNESFDEGMILNEKDLPHNPMITSGAIMTCNFIKPAQKVNDRLQYVMDVWERMTGGKTVEYNDESFSAEREEANKHYALAHLMKERGAFPEDVALEPLIDFYLKCCAVEVNIDDLAHAAATLANYGTCPSSGRKVFKHDTIRDTLSLMLSSGTYDHSGEFAFRVGLPAKSGIAGGIMIVVPQLMGIAVYSPPLDTHGNSARGIAFCEELVDTFNLHQFDATGVPIHGKKDPRK